MRRASSCYPDETKETLPECRGAINIDVMLTLISGNSRDLNGPDVQHLQFAQEKTGQKTNLFIYIYVYFFLFIYIPISSNLELCVFWINLYDIIIPGIGLIYIGLINILHP